MISSRSRETKYNDEINGGSIESDDLSDSSDKIAGNASFNTLDIIFTILFIVISIISFPYDPKNTPLWKVVWFYGWITALSTGLPTFFCW